MLTETQLSKILSMVQFASPIPKHLAKLKPDAGFLSPAYKRERDSEHQGEDLNGAGGGNTDFGLPVRSEIPGRILEIDARNGWGLSVLIEAEEWVRQLFEYALQTKYPETHSNAKLSVLHFSYHHLHQVTVTEGMYVNAGWDIGSIGDGRKTVNSWFMQDWVRYTAHLHREIRHVSLPCLVRQKGRSRDEIIRTHMDPQLFRECFSITDRGNTIPSARMVGPYRIADFDDDSENSTVVINVVNGKLFTRNS